MKIAQVPWMPGEDVPVLAPDTPVASAAKQLNENRIGLAVVVDGLGKVLGVISKTDIVQVAADWPSRLDNLRITHLFTRDPLTCTAADDARALFDTMIKRDIRHVPLVEDGRLAGLVSYENLRNYLTGVPPPQAIAAAPAQPARNDSPASDSTIHGGSDSDWSVDPPSVDSLIHVDDFDETKDDDTGFYDYIPDSTQPGGRRRIPSAKYAAFAVIIFVGLVAFLTSGELGRLFSFEPELGAGLDIHGVRSNRETVEGQEALVVRGSVSNMTADELSVPGIEVVLIDGKGNAVQSLVVATRQPRLLPQKETTFRAAIINPSPMARRIEVSFVERSRIGHEPDTKEPIDAQSFTYGPDTETDDGLEFKDVESTRDRLSGVDRLTVQGKVYNSAFGNRNVPGIKIILTGEDGHVLQSMVVSTLPPHLRAKQTATFRATFEPPSPYYHSFDVVFLK